MRTLIVGGTRYLGAAIARELVQHNYEVAVLHRGHTRGDVPDPVTHLLGDARDANFLEGCLREGRYDAVIDTILNVQDLARILPSLQRYTGQLIHCGSTGVYAPADCVPSRETDPTPCPPELGGFGGKLAQDDALLAFHRETGFKVCSLRVSNVIGPGDVPLDFWGSRDPASFQRLVDHKPIWIPNDGRALVQPVHHRDLARGFRAAMQSEAAAGNLYNLSSDRPVTLETYARTAAELMGSHSEMHLVPVDRILDTGKADESGLRFLCEHMCIDITKARRDLGYEPEMDVRASLRETFAWMIERRMLHGASLERGTRGNTA